MTVALWAAVLAPLPAAAVAVAVRRSGRGHLACAALAALLAACGVALVAATRDGGDVVAAGGLLRADALSAWMLTVIGAVALVATWGGGTAGTGRAAARQTALVCAFLGTMALAVLADDIGVMWVAVEATTVTTAFLVGHSRGRGALEAAWKYVVIGSAGLAIAFLGVVLLYAASARAGDPTLSWRALRLAPPAMDPDLVALAAALAVLGFATKAGLAPMHSWLPDAHAQAPAPVSALMSGVLLSVALYAVLRVQAVADPVIGTGLVRGMLAAGAVGSVAVAALLLVRQGDLKRMLAYSSIEHMGLMALGAAAGGRTALTALLLHMLGHGLAKAGLFVVAGRIVAAEGTAAVADIRGLLARRPGLAAPFLAGMAALLGLPPFSLFFSELGILLGAVEAGLWWAAGAVLALLVVLSAALVRLTARLTLGPATGERPPDRGAHGPAAPIGLALAAGAVVAFAATPVGSALSRAAATLAG